MRFPARTAQGAAGRKTHHRLPVPNLPIGIDEKILMQHDTRRTV